MYMYLLSIGFTFHEEPDLTLKRLGYLVAVKTGGGGGL